LSCTFAFRNAFCADQKPPSTRPRNTPKFLVRLHLLHSYSQKLWIDRAERARDSFDYHTTVFHCYLNHGKPGRFLTGITHPLPTISHWTNAMPSIPVDVLREILEHVDRADLATICRLNKICCSYSQDVLYRHIHLEYTNPFSQRQLYQTLSQSTHLAERVLSIYGVSLQWSFVETIVKALRNMTSLRHLHLSNSYSDVLDGCTFRLHSFYCLHSDCDSESLRNFLRNQTSLTDITCLNIDPSVSIEATSLPNLTQVASSLYSVSHLIPGRPVSDVNIVASSIKNSADLSFFTLSTAPLQKLTINYSYLYPKSGELLASNFPSLKDLKMVISFRGTHPVCVSFYSLSN
jgi:hypothetical protein